MEAYPLKNITLNEAINLQFKLVDKITKEFKGSEFLTRGDLGVIKEINKPQTTLKAERAIAAFFDAEKAILVRGSGTGAIRYAMHSLFNNNDTILIHKAPIYNTTKTSFEMLGLNTIEADFNDLSEIKRVMDKNPEIKGALVQYTRQSLTDSYDFEEVIQMIKKIKNIPIVTDDNYAVMKVAKIGTQCGADLACFSTFKLLGPEGIGCIVGNKEPIDKIVKMHYSGGMQTQGFEALDVLRGLVYAPVALAIQAQVNDELLIRLKNGEVTGIKDATIVNAQSKVLIVEFEKPIAKQVLVEAELLGGLPNPIGAESKYEIPPLFYRVSGTVLASDPTVVERMIRINPNRAGANTIIRILQEAVEKVSKCY